jgi:ribosomal protein S18 acetylase RimI-like enzyme
VRSDPPLRTLICTSPWGIKKMNFRLAQPGDAERVANLHAESWRRTYRGMMRDAFLDGDALSNRLEVWRSRLDAPMESQFVLLAECEGALAGFVCVYGNEDVLWGSLIDNLHVSAEHVRQGVGTALMLHAAKWLSAAYPSAGVYLWVMEANARARKFYERLGASNAGTRTRLDPGGGSAINCRYVWRRPESLLQVAPK